LAFQDGARAGAGPADDANALKTRAIRQTAEIAASRSWNGPVQIEDTRSGSKTLVESF
jgi:hypothetical protein